jgi:hypothetical protein
MDTEQAVWLAGLIQQAVEQIQHQPGLTVEVEESAELWVQVIPEPDESGEELHGFLLNFPYRGQQGDPLDTISAAGLSAPPDTKALAWEDGGFARLWIRPDVPLVAFSFFIGHILENIVDAPADAELVVDFDVGF